MNARAIPRIIRQALVTAGAAGLLVGSAHAAGIATVFDVVGSLGSASTRDVVAAELDADELLLREDGALFFVDPDRLAHVPTLAGEGEGGYDEEDGGEIAPDAEPDLDALSALELIPDGEAVDRARSALEAAGLIPAGAPATVDHDRIDIARAEDGAEILSVELDTHVDFTSDLDGIPHVGPGNRAKVVFDADGQVAAIHVARRALVPGATVPIRSAAEALEECRAGAPEGAADHMGVDLVYFAPPLSEAAPQILPQYRCRAADFDDPATPSPRDRMLPAVVDAPVADLAASISGGVVDADVMIDGGTPPYRIRWTSSTTALEDATDAAVTYTVAPGKDVDVDEESVSVLVTDANGLVTLTQAQLPVGGSPGIPTGTGARGRGLRAPRRHRPGVGRQHLQGQAPERAPGRRARGEGRPAGGRGSRLQLG